MANRKAQEETEATGFVNPFTPGVSYDDFLAAIPEGQTVDEYCENDLNQEELDFLNNELKHYEANQKTTETVEEEE